SKRHGKPWANVALMLPARSHLSYSGRRRLFKPDEWRETLKPQGYAINFVIPPPGSMKFPSGGSARILAQRNMAACPEIRPTRVVGLGRQVRAAATGWKSPRRRSCARRR